MDEPLSAAISDAIAILERTPGLLAMLLRDLPDERIAAPADGDWSPRDVVAHLLTTETPFVERVTRMAELEDPPLPAHDEREILEAARGRPLGSLLDELARSRESDSARLRALPPEAWTRTGQHEEVGTLTIAELVYHKAHHDLVHLAQLATMLRAPFDAARGPMRAY